MEGLVPIAIWISVILAGVGILVILLFGARSLMHGKISPLTLVIVVLPAVLLVLLGFVMGSWAEAGIWTLFIMAGLAILSLLLSGLRGLFA